MSKLIYRTKVPKKGCINYESFMTHEISGSKEEYPSKEIQEESHNIVQDAMYELIKKLNDLGYDQTKVRFSIHFKY
jgi:hypothetical protein